MADEKTAEQYQEEIDQLTNDLSAEQTAHSATKTEFEKAKSSVEILKEDNITTKDALEKEQADHLKTKGALETEKSNHLATMTQNTSLEETIEDMELKLKNAGQPVADNKNAVAKKAMVPKETFTVGDEGYVFTIPKFRHNGKDVTADQALQDTPLLAELVEMKFGGIKRFVKED